MFIFTSLAEIFIFQEAETRFKDNMSSIIINTRIGSVNIDNKNYTNNFLKPNKTIMPSMGMCHRQHRWDNTADIPSNIHYDHGHGCMYVLATSDQGMTPILM